MNRSLRRLILLVGVVLGLLVAFALAYQFGMARLEGRERTFWNALEWSAETLSTTGYGADASWRHPAMVLLVVVVQFVGVFLVFLVFPIYLIPFLEERFEKRLPREAPRVRDHIVVLRSGPAVETLLGELRDAGLVPVVVEDDEPKARRLFDAKHHVVAASVGDGGLERARIAEARSLVLNAADDENALAALIARQHGFRGEIIALVEEPALRKPLLLAGATRVFTPRHVLGAALAARASRKVSPTVSGLGAIGRQLRISELRIAPKSPLAGKSLAEAGLGAELGVAVLGQWLRGRLSASAGPETRLEPGSIVIAAGSESALRRLAEMASGDDAAPERRGRFVIAGLGEVGRVARDILTSVGDEVLTADRNAATGADLVGDLLDPAFVARTSPETADAVLLALDTDASTLFSALVLRDRAPHVPIVARVNEAANIERIHMAGADFALSISQVTAQIVLHHVLGERAVAVEPGLKVGVFVIERPAGTRLGDLRLREAAGCSAVALERGDQLELRLSEQTTLERGDQLYLAGSADALRRAAQLLSSQEGTE